MSNVRISASLPKGDANGLGSVASRFLRHGEEPVFAIVRLTGYEVKHDIETGTATATCRALNLEPIVDALDVERVHSIMRSAYSARTGLLELPFDEVTDDAPDQRPRPKLDPDELGARLRAEYGVFDADEAETLKHAATEVITSQYAGAEMVRAKLNVGPAAAVKLLQQLGDLGVVADPDGRPTRMVLARRSDLRDVLAAIDAAAVDLTRTDTGWPIPPAPIPPAAPGVTVIDLQHGSGLFVSPRDPDDDSTPDDDAGPAGGEDTDR